MYISHRSGADNPRRQNFDVNRNLLSLWSFSTSFKKISLKSDFIQAFFMIVYMYIAPRQGLTTRWGWNFDVNKNILSLWSFSASLKKISLKSDFIPFFSWFYIWTVVYSPGQTAPREQILMSTERPYHFTHLLQVSKKSLWSLILYNLFSWFNTCIWPRGKGWQPTGDTVLMSTEMSCHFIHLLQLSKQYLWNLILYNFFHDLIRVYIVPVQGAYSPQGTKFWCQQKLLVTSVICC